MKIDRNKGVFRQNLGYFDTLQTTFRVFRHNFTQLTTVALYTMGSQQYVKKATQAPLPTGTIFTLP